MRIMTLSPYTLSTHNCFVHAIIVTFSNLAINIIDIPVFFSFPDVVPQFVTWSNNYTLHALEWRDIYTATELPFSRQPYGGSYHMSYKVLIARVWRSSSRALAGY